MLGRKIDHEQLEKGKKIRLREEATQISLKEKLNQTLPRAGVPCGDNKGFAGR